jgi:hypothetical protein
MSRQFRYRVAAIVLSGFCFGVPLLANGTANATPATVPVTTSSPLPAPIDLPTVPVPDGTPQRPGGLRTQPVPDLTPPHPTKASTSRPPAKRPSVAHHWTRSRPHVRHPRARAPRAKHHVAPRSKIKVKVKTPTGTAGSAGGSGVPGLELPSSKAEPRAGAQPTTRLASSPSALAEPVSTMRPLPVENRVGLLGVIAAVCVVGVAIAAIRSIVSQRANRRIVA